MALDALITMSALLAHISVIKIVIILMVHITVHVAIDTGSVLMVKLVMISMNVLNSFLAAINTALTQSEDISVLVLMDLN
jgi:hypothetical protein